MYTPGTLGPMRWGTTNGWQRPYGCDSIAAPSICASHLRQYWRRNHCEQCLALPQKRRRGLHRTEGRFLVRWQSIELRMCTVAFQMSRSCDLLVSANEIHEPRVSFSAQSAARLGRKSEGYRGKVFEDQRRILKILRFICHLDGPNLDGDSLNRQTSPGIILSLRTTTSLQQCARTSTSQQPRS